jgi:hypothetical protein
MAPSGVEVQSYARRRCAIWLELVGQITLDSGTSSSMGIEMALGAGMLTADDNDCIQRMQVWKSLFNDFRTS